MKKNISNRRGEILIYKAKNGQTQIEVKLQQETIWLNQAQIASLFNIERSVITKHLRNIFKSKELNENSVCAKIAHTAPDGKNYKTNFYNLDVIISVGYRVNSRSATQFRIWATKILKDYLVKGYSLNQKKLQEQQSKFKELQNTIDFIAQKSRHPELQAQVKELLDIVQKYSRSFKILQQYDSGKLKIQKQKSAQFILTYSKCLEIIKQTKSTLAKKGEASNLFGQDASGRFKGTIGSIYQTFDQKELYKSLEEKAAHLLYLTIKDHNFIDGNKRIASLFFIYFLYKNNYLYRKEGEQKINDNTLVALALLIATSDPKEKDTMIKIVTNLLN
ncbi:virulence RhuM family protein [Patescibacteria group bacterium]|nr:virulence RhuM family protein [Patescibacteria group bacterium]